MVRKDELLKDLKDAFALEEETVGKISEYYSAMGWRSAVRKESRETIENGLAVLKADTEKHAKMLKEMAKYVEGAGKDEL